MFTSCTIPSYTKQDSTSSTESNDKEASSLKNTIQYGPISIRLCKKQAPTLETGRRSKHLVLVGEEAIKREKRREKNREAARKLKEKRQLIEEELNQKLKDLENQHSSLENYLQELHQRKQILQNKVNNIIVDPLEELLSNDSRDITLFVKQYSNDFDLFDESIDTLLNYGLDTSFYPVTNK
jgi:predicted RNase H-like nuclease (RuvC/YqgF family)